MTELATTRSPGARTTRAAARSTRTSAPTATSLGGRPQAPRGRDPVDRRRGRPGVQRLRRDRARQLPADEDLASTRTSTSRSASTRCPTAASCRPPAAASCACTTRKDGTSKVIATLPVYTNSEDGLYGPAVDNDFATNKWVYLYYAPATVENVKQSDGTTKTITTPPNDSAPTTAAEPDRLGPVSRLLPALALQVRRRGEPDDRPRVRAEDPAASPTTAARAATSPVTSTSTSTTTCGWSRATTRPSGAGN